MIFTKLIIEPKEVVNKVLTSLVQSKPLLLTYFNQHCFNIYIENDNYKKIIDNVLNVYQADLGVHLALKLLIKNKSPRIDATRMNELIINELIREKYSLAIIGGNFKDEFIHKEAVNKGINFIGYHNGFFDKSQTDDVIKHLTNLDARVYLIGMGVPRQEIFAEKLSRSVNSKVIICVGNFLEFYFGTKKRAPVFIQRIGLEWVFRLLTEPKRLWKRYLIGIPVFFYRIIKLKFKLIKGSQL